MLKIIKATACVIVLVGGAQAAFADELPREFLNRLMTECRPDYHRVCSEVIPGDGRVGRCLEDHEEQLSPGCLKAVKYAHAVHVCFSDAQHFCSGVPIEKGGMLSCLGEHMEGLSPRCQRVVQANLPYASPNGGDHHNAYSSPYDRPGYGHGYSDDRYGYGGGRGEGYGDRGYGDRYGQREEQRYDDKGYDRRYEDKDREYREAYGHDESGYNDHPGEGRPHDEHYEDDGHGEPNRDLK